MNKADLVDHVAASVNLSKADAAAALEAVMGGIAKALKRGEDVRLVGFGTFSPKFREAGIGRNPKTGEVLQLPASSSASFKAGQALKDELNKG